MTIKYTNRLTDTKKNVNVRHASLELRLEKIGETKETAWLSPSILSRRKKIAGHLLAPMAIGAKSCLSFQGGKRRLFR